MDSRQYAKYQQYEVIHKALADVHVDPMPPLLVRKREELENCVAHCKELSEQQRLARTAVGSQVKQRIGMLRTNRMKPLSDIAKPILAYAAGAEEALRVPHKRTRAAAVAEQAVKMAEFLESHADLLADALISREFLDEFRTEAHFLASVTSRARNARQRQTSATRQLREEIEKGKNAVQVIYGLLRVHLGNNDEIVARLRSLMQRHKPVGRPPKKRSRPR